MIGRIDRLVQQRGFGFIITDDGNRIWFHARHVRNRPFDALVVGEKVELDYDKDDLGRFAATTVEAL